MGQRQSLTDSLNQFIHNRDAKGLTEFLHVHASELNSNALNETVFVRLVREEWDCDTIDLFAKLADDHQLAVLISSAVLEGHVVPLASLFGRMKDRPNTIEHHGLKHLFLTTCERENINAVRTFIQNKCYDPADPRPIRAVLRAQLKKSVPNVELMKMVLDAHPLQAANVNHFRKKYLSDARNDEARKLIDELLCNYIP